MGWRLLVFYAAVALVAAELGFRLFHFKQLALGAGIEHPHFHHRLHPDTDYRFTTAEFDVTIHTNRFGLRGPVPIVPKPPGTIRLLMLGDSYIFGFPVKDEETAAVLAERALRAKGYPVEVINAGVSGYSPTLQYVSLRDQFLAFEPDVVVLWYDLGDLTEDANFQKNILRDQAGGILRVDPRYVHGRYDWGEALRRRSMVAKYLNNKVARTWGKIQTLGLRGYLEAKLRGEPAKVAIARLKRAQGAADAAQFDKFILVRPDVTRAQLERLWQTSAGYLDRIRELVAAREIPLILGAYPYGMLAGPQEWGDGRVFWGFEKGRTYEATTYLELLGNYAGIHGVPLINAFPRFQSAVGVEPLFYNWDGHMTPAGQRVLAQAFADDPRVRALLDRLYRPLRRSTSSEDPAARNIVR